MTKTPPSVRLPTSHLRKRLFTSFVVIVIGSAAVITVSSMLSDWRSRQNEIAEQLQLAAIGRQVGIERWFDNLQTALSLLFTEQVMSTHVETVTTKPRESQAFRDSYAHLAGDFNHFLVGRANLFDQVFVMDTRGRIVLATDPTLEGKDASPETFFHEGLMRAYVAPPVYSPESNAWRLTAVYPVINERGQTIGVAAGNARMAMVNALMTENIGLGSTGETYLISADDNSIITPIRGNATQSTRTIIRTPSVESTLKSRSPSFQLSTNYAGIATVGFYTWLPQMNAVLVAEQTQSEVFASVMIHLAIDVGVSIIVVLLTIVLALRVIRTITSPLAELTETVTRIGAGNLDLTAHGDSTDEIGALARAFNSMTAQLRSAINRLKEQVAELEQAEKRAQHLASFPQLNPNPVIELDATGKIIFSNPATQEILEHLGLGKETVHAFMPPDLAQILAQAREKSGSVFYREVTIKDRIFGENISLALPLDVVHIYAFDITERMRVEEALQVSEERYRSLFENMIDGFAHCKLIYDDQGRPIDFVYLAVNRAFGQLTGLKNVVGKPVTEVIPGIKESHPELFEIYGRVASTGKSEKFELDFKPLALWLSISVYSREPGYFVAVFENVTERRHMEEALRRARDELEQRVADRTAELVQTNQQLSQEITERVRAQEAERALAASLEQRVTDRTRELSALYGVSSIASRAENVETLLDKSLVLMTMAMRSLGSTMLLLDETKNGTQPTRLRVAAQEGKPVYRMPRREIALSEVGIAELVIRQREPLLIPDLTNDPRVTEAMRRVGPRTLLLAPLKAEGKVLGIISMMRDATQPFTVEEVALLTNVAEQIGISMQRLKLRELAQQNILLEERQRLARDMHDSVTQSLYGLATLTEATQGHLEAGDLPSAQRTLVRFGQTIRQALKEMRLFIFQLRPSVINGEGLIGALQFRLAAVEGRSDVRTHIVADETIRLPRTTENALYQIAQEALNNILRHANANSITISLQRQAGLVVLEIVDDGRGFDVTQIGAGGMGLNNIRELAHEIEGTFEITSEPLKGTHIKITVAG